MLFQGSSLYIKEDCNTHVIYLNNVDSSILFPVDGIFANILGKLR